MDNLQARGGIISIFISIVLITYMIRLFTIQVFNAEYEGKANQNVIKTKIITPPRGALYDRDTTLYVTNDALFDLTVTPGELNIPDTNVLLKGLDMTKEDLIKALKHAKKYSDVRESSIARNISPSTSITMREQMWDFGGFDFYRYNTRKYIYPVGANFLGYISEVDSNQMKAKPENMYILGDLVGKAGIEKSYETEMLGKKGKHVILKDVHGREVGSYRDGAQDVEEVPGNDLLMSIDLDLQRLGEEMMQNKRGSVVAIEPSTGEVLAFISSPTYDPNMLTGSELKKNWSVLQQDPNKPLFNRPIMATYPPGSIFKLAMALAALNDGVIAPQTHYGCGGGFRRNKGKPRCHGHPGFSGLSGAIQYSCNSYFAAVYYDYLMNHPKYENIYDAYHSWYNYMVKLGIGQKLKVDLPFERSGQIPSAEMYDDEKRWYGHNRWVANTIISNAIGQGEVLMTPMQMANLVAIIANRGYYIQPHLVKAMRKREANNKWHPITFPRVESGIAKQHYDVVIAAMEDVVRSGTARRATLKDIIVCGKTGTVQNPHGGDHAVFIAFAPRENPKIAIATIIENAGASGGSWAAPLVGAMIEKYLTDTIIEKKVEFQRVKSANFMK